MNDSEQRMLRLAEDRIWRAWFGAIVAGSLFLLLALLGRDEFRAERLIFWLSVADALFTIVLAWAMQRWNSRFAASLLVLRAFLSGISLLKRASLFSGAAAIAFAVLYAYGLHGTVALRRFRRASVAARTV